MYEADFLAVEADGGPSSKSGDAIAVRFTRHSDSTTRVVVIDAGFKAAGQDVVDHITKYYGTRRVDLVISTHPDVDHLNGLRTVVEELDVAELMIHRPRLHSSSVAGFTNIEAVDELIDAALAKGTVVTEPFAGVSRFDGQLAILGPSLPFYEEKLAEHLAEVASGYDAGMRASAMLKAAGVAFRDLLARVLQGYPTETLGEGGVTSPRNETSVVTLIRVDGRRLLFTGDAGLEGISAAADRYETLVGSFDQNALRMFQAPHHGSRRNLSPSLLDRIVGRPGAPFGSTVAIISSAKADPKHPSPKVSNALGRRGLTVLATEGVGTCHSSGAPSRTGWSVASPVPPVDESDDE